MSPVPAPIPAPTSAPAPSSESTGGAEAAQPTDGATQDNRPALSGATLDFAAKMFDLARAGDLKLIHYLAAGLPPNLTNQRGDSLLMLAAYHGHEALVSAMLGHPPPESSAATTRSTSESAAEGEEGQQEAVQDYAIPTLPPARQPDVNQLNAKGQSILAGAVFKSYPSVAKLLVTAGADPLAGEPNAEETAKMFKKWEAGDDPLAPTFSGYRDLFEGASGRGRGGVSVGGLAPVAGRTGPEAVMS
ncbi:hypothetical protein V8E36_008039 [Tilletia maclaganii]